MYISAHISFNGNSAEIDFPVSDEMLDTTLREAEMPTDTTLPFFVEDIHYPVELSSLNCEYINLDELNYLAKRLDSFSDDEIEQFYAAVEHKKAKGLRSMINISYNLDKFTIIKDISNMTKVGRAYTLNTEGSVPVDTRYDEKFAEIGRKLLGSGRGVFTEYGLLFVEDKPIQKVYEGDTFPGFAYNGCIVNVDIAYRGRYESIFLPESQLAIEKAIHRLGAKSIDDCECTCEYEDPNYGAFSVRFEDILDHEGVCALNAFCHALDEQDIDVKKLRAITEMTGVSSSKNLITLIDYLDDFELISDIDCGDYSKVGRYYLEHSDEYEISPDLEDFFNYDEFGEHIADEYSGEFTSYGFIYYNGTTDISEMLSKLEEDNCSMTRGGI